MSILVALCLSQFNNNDLQLYTVQKCIFVIILNRLTLNYLKQIYFNDGTLTGIIILGQSKPERDNNN